MWALAETLFNENAGIGKLTYRKLLGMLSRENRLRAKALHATMFEVNGKMFHKFYARFPS